MYPNTLIILVFISFCSIPYGETREVTKFYKDGIGFAFDEELVIGQDNCQIIVINAKNPAEFVTVDTWFVNTHECYFDIFKGQVLYSDNYKLKLTGSTPLDIDLLINSNETVIRDEKYVMAVDYISEKLYAIPPRSNKLIVIDMRTNDIKILFSNLDSPNFIAVDPEQALLFIAQPKSIFSSSLDGTMFTKIVSSTNEITGLTLDQRHEKIYWSTLNTIETANYDGKNSKIVLKNNTTMKSLTSIGERIYWYESNPTNQNNSILKIWTCNVNNCEKTVFGGIIIMPQSSKFLIKGYNSSDIIKKKSILPKTYPCRHSECEQMCLTARTFKGFSCACRMGFKLRNDLISCEKDTDLVKDYLLYATDDLARSVTLDCCTSGKSTDVKYPTRLSDDVHLIDIDYRKQTMYYIDGLDDNYVLYEKELSSFKSSTKLMTFGKHSKFMSFSFDWMTKNFYASLESSNVITVYVLHFSGHQKQVKLKKIIQNNTYADDQWFQSKFHQVLVDPVRGYLYILANNRDVYKCYTDGSECKSIFKDDGWDPKLDMALDFHTDKMYLLNFDGSITILNLIKLAFVKTIQQNCLPKPRKLQVYKNWFYLSDAKRVCRVLINNTMADDPSLTGEVLVNINSSPKLVRDFKIFSSIGQPNINDHPCAEQNGGCDKFCFGVPTNGDLKRQCGCEDGEKLADDGKSCEKPSEKLSEHISSEKVLHEVLHQKN